MRDRRIRRHLYKQKSLTKTQSEQKEMLGMMKNAYLGMAKQEQDKLYTKRQAEYEGRVPKIKCTLLGRTKGQVYSKEHKQVEQKKTFSWTNSLVNFVQTKRRRNCRH